MEDHDVVDECTVSHDSSSFYSTSLHLFGLLCILLVSLLSVSLSLLLGNRAKTSLFLSRILQLLKMFGIGVIAGTAWCHLIPEAIEQFGSPCLGGGIWTGYGSHWMGVFALVASFLVQQIEMSGSHSHSLSFASHDHLHEDHLHSVNMNNNMNINMNRNMSNNNDLEENVSVSLPAPPAARSAPDTLLDNRKSQIHHYKSVVRKTSSILDSSATPPHSKLKRLQTVILEVGILTHSLIIGVTLGLTPDLLLPTLLAAISFHQFFEGLALGILVAESIPSSLWKQVQMIGLYPIVTPAGIAIGIFLQSRNTTGSSSSLIILLQAIFGSLSSGILIYNTYCELFAREISLSPYFAAEVRGWFRVFNFVFLYLGAASMAVIAFWA